MLKHFLGYRIGNLLYLIEAAYVCGLAAGHAQPPTAGGGGTRVPIQQQRAVLTCTFQVVLRG